VYIFLNPTAKILMRDVGISNLAVAWRTRYIIVVYSQCTDTTVCTYLVSVFKVGLYEISACSDKCDSLVYIFLPKTYNPRTEGCDWNLLKVALAIKAHSCGALISKTPAYQKS
jgi:hypothetical protein